MLDAARVIAIDRLPERLGLARSLGAIVVDFSEEDVSVLTAIKDLTAGVRVCFVRQFRRSARAGLFQSQAFTVDS